MGFTSDDFEDSLSFAAEDRVRSELEPGEKLIWAGRPRPSRLVWSTIPIVLFGIPWTAFACFWVGMALTIGAGFGNGPAPFRIAGIFFPLFGLPFIAIGFAMLASPYFVYKRALRTFYALTDNRILLIEPTFRGGRRIQSLVASDLGSIIRIERADGSGDLNFNRESDAGYDPRHSRHSRRSNYGGGQYHRTILGIENVREVETLIRKTLLG